MSFLEFPDIEDKIILIYLSSRPDEHNAVLQKAHFENQGGRIFIVGEFAEGTTANDWASGVSTAIAWDQIEQYLVFDSLEDYFSRMSRAWDSPTMQ